MYFLSFTVSLFVDHMSLLVAMVWVVVGVYGTAGTANENLVQLGMPNTTHNALKQMITSTCNK